MQHVCDCRNPLWPLRSSSWRTVPETRCQAASGGTSSMPNPRHTRRPCSPPSREARPALCFFSCLYPFIWHGCQPVVRRSQRPPGRRIQALLLPSSPPPATEARWRNERLKFPLNFCAKLPWAPCHPLAESKKIKERLWWEKTGNLPTEEGGKKRAIAS